MCACVYFVSVYKCFKFLVKFIPRYFILFDATINGIVFLIPLSDSLLLVNRNAKDFCMLILYSTTILNLFISCNCLFDRICRLSIHKIMSSANSDSFISSFTIWMPFISSSCLMLWLGLPILC
uniref:Uncharacterized protein n=2 Tax=Canis lupus familiaris TaxID=9615 RepID=A0A8P0TMH7_CANLF